MLEVSQEAENLIPPLVSQAILRLPVFTSTTGAVHTQFKSIEGKYYFLFSFSPLPSMVSAQKHWKEKKK